MDIRLKKARISFAQGLWKKSKAAETAEPKYNCDFIVVPGCVVERKNDEGKWVKTTLQEIEKLVAIEAFKGNEAKANSWREDLQKNQRSIRDGNKNKKDGEIRAGYEGCWYVHATSTTRMPVLNALAQEVNSEEESPIYSGCYVTARVSVYAMLKSGQQGIFCSLAGTQFVGDGDSFGGNRRASKEDFEPVDEDSGADASDYA